MNKPFQTKLKELREAAGYKSQQAFADAFGVAQSTVGNWEAGKREPNYETTIKLANFFHVPVDQLLGNDEFVFSAEILKAIGTKIALAAADLGLSPEECLIRLLISTADTHRMVNGAYPFTSSTLAQVADCLKKPMDYFLPGYTKTAPALTKKDERDIERKLADVLEELEGGQDGLMFSGAAIDDTTRELLAASLRNSMQLGKTLAKQKFTPKKFRKED